MTNPTRTRADTPEVFGSVAWDMKLIAMIADVAVTYKHTDEFAPYWSQILRLLDFVRVTAASDLIPREEHERAVDEARKVTTTDAMAKLVQELKDDEFQAPAIRMDWSDFSGAYRVTVERVDAEPADAELVGWGVDYMAHKERATYFTSDWEDAEYFAKENKGRITPFYRRPFDPVAILECAEGMAAYPHGSEGFVAYRARLCGLLGVPADTEVDSMNLTPMPVAVAPTGVVEEIREIADSAGVYGWSRVREIADCITELPDPSDDVAYYDDDRLARIAFPSSYFIGLQHTNGALQLAADCIKAATLLKNEGRISAPKPEPANDTKAVRESGGPR